MENITKKIVVGLDGVNDNTLYTPKEVVELPVVKKSQIIPSVFTLYRLMKSGKIISTVDKSTGELPRYLISGKNVKSFLKSRYQLK
jgi:hypothetical protein